MDDVVRSLADAGLQSDERYIEAYVTSRIGKGFGPLRISSELRQRGVDSVLISACLGGQSAQWCEHASAARAKRFGLDVPKGRREQLKQMRFLEYRGFTSDQIRSACRDAD